MTKITKEIPIDDIMRSDNEMQVTANNVEMVLEAWKNNEFQNYYNNSGKPVSKVIKLN